MSCPTETHQFLTSWKNILPQQLWEKYNDFWVENLEDGYFGFIPKEARALILGTFPVPELRTSGFFYHSDVNLFWSILATISASNLPTLADKLSWLTTHKFAITDILMIARRKDANCRSRQDEDLEKICYNNLFMLLKDHPKITDIFLTSGGPISKSLFGTSAGGWLGSHLKEVTKCRTKHLSQSGATLEIQIRPTQRTVRLHYLITPAPQDKQLGKHLRDCVTSVPLLCNIKYLESIAEMKEKYKCLQWAVYLSKIPGVVNDDFQKEINETDLRNILQELQPSRKRNLKV